MIIHIFTYVSLHRPAGDQDNYEYTPDHHPSQQQEHAKSHPAHFSEQHQYEHSNNQPMHNNFSPAQAQPVPSTATMELDDLMATLSEFKVSHHGNNGNTFKNTRFVTMATFSEFKVCDHGSTLRIQDL